MVTVAPETVKVEVVTPLYNPPLDRLDQFVPPSVLSCHWYSRTSVPVPEVVGVTVNVALPPNDTVWSTGKVASKLVSELLFSWKS